jgi:hypothetical protein
MTPDQGIALASLAATIIFGILGVFVWKTNKSRKQVQRQSVTKGGIAIQSGRDTKIKK